MNHFLSFPIVSKDSESLTNRGVYVSSRRARPVDITCTHAIWPGLGITGRTFRVGLASAAASHLSFRDPYEEGSEETGSIRRPDTTIEHQMVRWRCPLNVVHNHRNGDIKVHGKFLHFLVHVDIQVFHLPGSQQ